MARGVEVAEFDYVLMRERERTEPRNGETSEDLARINAELDEERTTWRLKVLNFAEREYVSRKALTEAGEITYGSMELARKALNVGLRGATNWRDRNGKPLEVLSTGSGVDRRINESVLDAIGEDAVELANAISETRTLPEELAKNST